MPTTVELTLACGDYEITRPLKDGQLASRQVGAAPKAKLEQWITAAV